MKKEKLQILATSQYGWPEPHPSLYPMEEMAKRGHDVYAITGMPNYPMGDIYDGYSNRSVIEEEHSGIHIAHVPIVPRKHDAIHRLFNYHSYPRSANKLVKNLDGRYDIVFANQASPVMMVEPAICYAKKWNKKVVMYCMDLWPASLMVGGVSQRSPLYKYYYKVSKKIYQNVDLILVTSKMFKQYFMDEFGIPEERIEYLPQYAISEFDYIPETEEKETTDILFAGNVGVAQNLYVLLNAARILKEQGITDHGKQLVFHIVGDGQELENLKQYSQKYDISNIVFHGRKPSEEMPKYYAFADAMFLALTSEPLISMTLPAKVQSYMASGKAIIASANGEIAQVIKESECGFCSDADDVDGLVDNIKRFINATNREQFGNKAKVYYEHNFSREIVMDKLEDILLREAK